MLEIPLFCARAITKLSLASVCSETALLSIKSDRLVARQNNRFERRFLERASLKGKDVKDELKDSESRSFLTDLVDDTLAVLGLPQWGVAEEFFSILLTRFDGLSRKSSPGLSPGHRAIVIDILSAAFLGLVKFSQRVSASGLAVDLPSSMLEAQQDSFCMHFAECSAGQCIAGPIKLARAYEGNEGSIFQERARQVVLNYLLSQESFARAGGICRDALVYLLVRWSAPKHEESPSQGFDSEEFFTAMLKFTMQEQPSPASIRAQSPCMRPEEAEHVGSKLALQSTLLTRLQNRLSHFLLHILNDGKGSDKAKVLRVVILDNMEVESIAPRAVTKSLIKSIKNKSLSLQDGFT